QPRLHARQRRLEVEITLHAILVGENPPHRLGGKNVAKDQGVEGGRRHARLQGMALARGLWAMRRVLSAEKAKREAQREEHQQRRAPTSDQHQKCRSMHIQAARPTRGWPWAPHSFGSFSADNFDRVDGTVIRRLACAGLYTRKWHSKAVVSQRSCPL